MGVSDSVFDRSELRIPLVLGVTGHRDLRSGDAALLCEAVRKIIQDFQDACSDTPIILLSPLPEGADSLCAEAALKMGGNVQVVAALPFPPEIYRATTSFGTDLARLTLDRLLADPRVKHFVTPLPDDIRPANDAEWKTLSEDPAARHKIYAGNGAFISQHSCAIIALWDGAGASDPSGTAELVHSQLSGVRMTALAGGLPGAFQWPETGPVWHVWTVRSGHPDTENRTGEIRTLWLKDDDSPLSEQKLDSEERKQRRKQSQSLQSIFKRMCANLDRFNGRVMRLPEEHLKNGRPKAVEKHFDNSLCHSAWVLERLAGIREAAAFLAMGRGKIVRNGTMLLFWLMAFGLFCSHFYVHWPTEGHATTWRPLLLWGFVLILTLCGGLVYWLRDVERDELDYRSLAEALRVQCAWAQAGIDRGVADSYLQQLRSELAWTRKAIQAILLPAPGFATAFQGLATDLQNNCLQTVRKKWLAGQEGFFEKKRKTLHHSHRLFHYLGFTLAFSGWAMAAWLLWSWKTAADPTWMWLASPTLLVVLGGLCLAYRERRLYGELAHRYGMMQSLFHAANMELAGRLDRNEVAGAQRLLVELGREALTENANWLVPARRPRYSPGSCAATGRWKCWFFEFSCP